MGAKVLEVELLEIVQYFIFLFENGIKRYQIHARDKKVLWDLEVLFCIYPRVQKFWS